MLTNKYQFQNVKFDNFDKENDLQEFWMTLVNA